MTTEPEKSRRETAEEIVDEHLDEMMSPREFASTSKALIEAIDKALRDRDERAARIIKEHRESDRCEGSCWEIITTAIRGKS